MKKAITEFKVDVNKDIEWIVSEAKHPFEVLSFRKKNFFSKMFDKRVLPLKQKADKLVNKGNIENGSVLHFI